ncbi:MAG: hypothetical protein IPH93_10360 [Saprospiraceae bacterium]|nr:hypothetical protein [Saprospiraceae bacterium]
MSVEKYNSRKLKIFFYLIGSFVFFGIVITYTFINITLKDFLIGMFPIFIVFIALKVIELIVGLIKKNIKFDLKEVSNNFNIIIK